VGGKQIRKDSNGHARLVETADSPQAGRQGRELLATALFVLAAGELPASDRGDDAVRPMRAYLQKTLQQDPPPALHPAAAAVTALLKTAEKSKPAEREELLQALESLLARSGLTGANPRRLSGDQIVWLIRAILAAEGGTEGRSGFFLRPLIKKLAPIESNSGEPLDTLGAFRNGAGVAETFQTAQAVEAIQSALRWAPKSELTERRKTFPAQAGKTR